MQEIFQVVSSLYALYPQVYQACAGCGNKSLSSSWITSCFSCYLARMCMIHNEHKHCPCVSWIATPWYLMENILFIQISHNNMFHQYFCSNKSKRNRLKRSMFLSLLCYFTIIWCEYLIVRRAGLLWSQQDFEWRWSVPLFKCLTVLEFSFILFDLCLLITFFNFIMNYVPIVTFWIFTYHKIWILSIMFCSIWSYWIIYFLTCLEVFWSVVS